MAYERLAKALIRAESGGRARARNPRSTATGAGQFLEDTWLETISKHRPDLAAGKSRAEILALRNDPGLSAEMTERYAADNSSYLSGRGIDPTPQALSLAHFAGPGGAVKVYSDPNETVRSLLGEDAVAANPFLKGKTGADLIDWAGKRLDSPKATAKRLRQRYSGGETGTENAPRAEVAADTPSPEAATENIKAKLGTALGRYDQLAKTGQQIAGRGNPLAAIGGTILAGIGGYQSGKAQREQQQARQRALEAAQSAKTPEELAAALMASPDEKMRAAGIRMRAESLGPKSPPQIQTITTGKDQFGRPITRKVYFDQQEGRFKPAEGLFGEETPSQPRTAPQTGETPQQGVAPQTGQTPTQRPEMASDGPIIRDLPDAGAQDGTQPQAAPDQSSLPDGMEAHPVPKENLPDGVTQRLAPDGSGYLWQRGPDGQLTPVLESEAEQKQRVKEEAEKPKLKNKMWGAMQATTRTHRVVQEDIQRALDNYLETGSWPETGIFAYLSNVPGTSAYDLSALLQTIKSNLGFDKLQEMRENSPTGGALGQVSNLELTALQSVLGNMSQYQSGEQLTRNLKRLSEILEEGRQNRIEAFRKDFGGLPDEELADDPAREKPGGKPQFSPGAEIGDADLSSAPEGTIVRDPRDGKRFIIRGGKPVLYGENR